MAKRSTKSDFTAEQICDGFLYANLEPSELPEDAEDVVGKYLDRYEERYWALIKDFWSELKREGRAADIQKLYQMTEGAKDLVEKGLRRQAAGKSYGEDSTESDASSDGESSEEARPAKPAAKSAGGKKDKAESPKKSTGSKKKTPAPAPAATASSSAPVVPPAASSDLASGAKKKKAPAATK